MIIEQIRHLQDKRPFELFALELDSGRVVQIYDPYEAATQAGQRQGEAVIGILYGEGCFELIDACHVVSVSVGLHPKVKEQLDRQMERARKIVGAGEEQIS